MHSRLKAVVLFAQPSDSCLVLALLVGMAGAKSVANPGKNLVVKCQPAEQFRELPL
jgi:hypothetical protein